MSDGPTILWFRQDLRLADNQAAAAALAGGGPVVPVFILDDDTPGDWRPGGASRWWLHHSLSRLGEALAARGSRLILARGVAGPVLDRLVAATGAVRVVWTRCYEPAAIRRDTAVKAALKARGVAAESHPGALLFEPWTVTTAGGTPYRVYTPFWRACRAAGVAGSPVPAPERLPAPAAWPESEALDAWGLRPTAPDWSGGLAAAWTPGEDGAQARLATFLDRPLGRYADQRDRPDLPGTSGLSPHLHWGEIGPRQIWRAVEHRVDSGRLDGKTAQAEKFLKEIVWREFSYNLLYHFPEIADTPLDARFAAFPWRTDDAALAAWQRGRTGYPIVDAGMRQLWAVGWMHNRVRMIVASFLVKHLLLPWQAGEAWFWDTLVDADLASNAASWQWVAGCGADAAPYFRIFNPVLQGCKFDPDGTYVRRWVPELATLDTAWLHAPWEAPAGTLDRAGIRLGRDYPQPIVDHRSARARALAVFEQIKSRPDPAAAGPGPQNRRTGT